MSDFYETKNILKESTNSITFGSCISFLSPNLGNADFLTFPGLLPNKILLHNFEAKKTLDLDFSFSLFKILPFEQSNFKYQALIKRDLVDKEEDFKKLGFFFKSSYSKLKLNEIYNEGIKIRKMKLQEYQMNLETEFISNSIYFNKMNGSPILYHLSNFLLFHLRTSKFLSFTIDSSQSRRLEKKIKFN